MAGREHLVYCAQSGSVVDAGNNFCGVCGARVPPSARETAPTKQAPAQSFAPSRVSDGSNNRALPLFLGLAAVLLVLIGIGAIVGFALVSGNGTNATQSSANEPAPAENRGPSQQAENKSTEASQLPTEQELDVGDSVKVDGVEATLNDVRILPTTDLDTPIQNPDNRFLATDSASQAAHTQQRELAEGEIGPAQRASGEIVYEVPPESRGLQLNYTSPSPAAAPTPGLSATCRTSPSP